MKVSVDVDCTPEEARRFMGLPDMSSVHEAYLSRMRGAIEQGITPDMIQSMMQAWSPMGEAGMAFWRQIMDQVGATGLKK